MDNQQARFILQSCRPGDADRRDPQFAEALAQAARDPELSAWFSDEQALDAALARKLKALPVPVDLPESILSGQEESPQTPRRVLPLLALAAAVVLLAALAALWFRPAPTPGNLASFRAEMLAHVSGRLQLAYTSASAAELTQWLAEQRSLQGLAIPAALKAKPALGCQSWTWHGKPVGLICFLIDGKNAVHLFVVDRAALTDAPENLQPSFGQENGWTTAAWNEGDKLYIIAGHCDQTALAKLL